MQAATPRFPASRAVTVASDWPSSSARVRVRCVARSRSPRLNHVSAPWVAIAARQLNVSPASPQPRSTSSMPASAYMTVSRSGETRSPQTSVSSPVLPMTVRSRCGMHVARPRMSLAAPVPPASVRTRMSVAEVLAKGPQRGAATPCIETRSRSTREIGRQGALGDGNEAETHPDPVEALRAREERDDPRGAGVIEAGGDELRGDLERIVLDADDGPDQPPGRTASLSDHGADQTLTAVRGPPRDGAVRAGGPGDRGEIEEWAGHRGVRQGTVADTLPDARNGRGCKRRSWGGSGPGAPRAISSPTSCQAPRPSGSWRGGTCRRAWPGS